MENDITLMLSPKSARALLTVILLMMHAKFSTLRIGVSRGGSNFVAHSCLMGFELSGVLPSIAFSMNCCIHLSRVLCRLHFYSRYRSNVSLRLPERLLQQLVLGFNHENPEFVEWAESSGEDFFNPSQVLIIPGDVLPGHRLSVPISVRGKTRSMMSTPEIPGELNIMAISRTFLICSIASSASFPEKVLSLNSLRN
ncbi:hypothetical protein Tco_1120044 [Tanacetum coccineum]